MLVETTTTLTPGSFAVGPIVPTTGPTAIRVPGATVLVAPQATPAAAETGLKSLRGFRTDGRRAVWCDLGGLASTPSFDVREFGRRLVEDGGAEMVIVSGQHGRDAALGARDAGLALGRVVVCRDEATARNVISDSTSSGDVILGLGIPMEGCQRLADRLESRLGRKALAK
jgi:hypothetical protein